MTRSDDAPLHERLEALHKAASDLSDCEPLVGWTGEAIALVTAEATAALRPPEGEVGEVIAELGQTLRIAEAGTSSAPGYPAVRVSLQTDDLRAALAHMRRLAAENARLREALTRAHSLVLETDDNPDWKVLDLINEALAPAPAAEPGDE